MIAYACENYEKYVMRQILSSEMMQSVVALAQQAGVAIMDIYRSADMGVRFKADASPLTQADLLAHALLARGLAELTPDVPVISEEDVDADAHAPRKEGDFWLIDPLDGTKEFLARNDEFTVNVALVSDGCPVFGVVVAPALEQTYWGAKDLGAFRVDTAGSTAIRAALPAHGVPLRIVASKSHMNAATHAFIAALGTCEVVQAGSSLKLCRIAEGAAHLYPRLGPTCEWDTAAAHAIVEAAGGQVTTLTGESLRYGKADVLNPHFIAACRAAATDHD